MLKQQIEKYARYTVWANSKAIDFLLASGNEALHKEQASSFSTLEKTAYRIYDAEYVWIKRIKGEPWMWPPSANLKVNSFDEFCGVWKNISEELLAFTQSLTETDLQKFVSYKNSKGEPFNTTIADCLMHCFNHSTYHRGQIITMLRGAGFTKVTSTDYISFIRLN